MTTIIPHVKNPGDNTGLARHRGNWVACYTQDGVRKQHKLCQTTLGAPVARKLRDTFYATLLTNGATVATRANRKAKAAANPMQYIRRREPYVVTIAGRVIAEVGTLKEAKAARDRAVGVKSNDNSPAAGGANH